MGFDLFRTPPFSSEEELDDEDLLQACASPDLLPVLSSKSNKSSFGRNTVKSDTDWTEGSEIEDSAISPKPTGKLLLLKIPLEILFRTVALTWGHQALGVRAEKVPEERMGLIQKLLPPKENGQRLAGN